MKTNRAIALLVGTGLTLASLTVVAHHSVSAEFDTSKKVTFTGSVKKVDWMNVRTWTLKQPTDVLMEYSCEENNLGIDDGSIVKWKYPEKVD